MKERAFNPCRLDVPAFAKAGAELRGEWPLAGLTRLQPLLAAAEASSEVPNGQGAPVVRWAARGHERRPRAAAPQPWLHVQAEAELPLVCQRCLQPMRHALSLRRDFQFVRDEAEAERLDGTVEHEVLVLGRDLDLRALIEDELLLDWPLVPRHAHCPAPLAGPVDAAAEAPHPFAALAALKRPR
jgi:uncharacterized protein